jgi:L-ascorbate metabolism protein UlaG (beta-lactamase superfamily)
MATEITWFGHNTWLIETGEHKILLDPFLDNNPSSPVKAKDVHPQFILISHGHFDHIDDAAAIANRCGSKVLANFEIATWLAEKHKVKDVVGMNHGGSVDMPFGRAKFVPAIHSSVLPDGTYGGNAGGWVLSLPEGNVYFACDTALFSDMQLIGQMGIELAVVPIGDLYTMGPDDAVLATKFINPKRVTPCHYNTWPPINQDADAWAKKTKADTSAKPIVLKPGEKFSL